MLGSTIGLVSMAFGGVLLIIGLVWIMRLTKVEV
jgi:hypothetical protein